MVDSPREVVGAVLKYMGASYNINNINLQVDGGRDAVQKNLEVLANQVGIAPILHNNIDKLDNATGRTREDHGLVCNS